MNLDKLEIKYPGLLDSIKANKLTDSAVGFKYGVSREYVRQIRGTLGLPRVKLAALAKVDQEAMIQDIASLPTSLFREKYGVSTETTGATRRKLGIEAPLSERQQELLGLFGHKLGKVPDNEIHRLYGVGQTTVSWFRKKLGIPPWKKRNPPYDKDLIRGWIRSGWKNRTIAQKLGTSVAVVVNIRKTLKETT